VYISGRPRTQHRAAWRLSDALDDYPDGPLVVTILLPSLLAAQAGGRGRFEVDAETAADALQLLPVAALLFDESKALRPLVNVYVDGVDVRARGGLGAPLEGAEMIRVVAAVAGG